MANPRDIVSYEGLDNRRVTFPIDAATILYDATKRNGSAQVGLAVTLSGNHIIALAGDGEAILGKLVLVESDGMASVITSGYVELPAGTGAGLTLGKKIVGDLLVAAKGYVREVATGTAAELGVARGMIIDAADTAAVIIML